MLIKASFKKDTISKKKKSFSLFPQHMVINHFTEMVFVIIFFQVVELDPVIEDDAELQKYSKVLY